MKDNYINMGTIIIGDVYNSSIENKTSIDSSQSTTVSINDPVAIAELLEAALRITPKDPKAASVAKDLQEELKSPIPRTGKLQALYDWLRRNCTVESTLNAIKFFGKILSKFI